MKAIITSAEFVKEFKGKYGTMYQHKIKYDGKVAQYSSQKKEQNKFVVGQETEFTEEERDYQGTKYITIKPIYAQGSSNFSRQVKREQSKYSGFAMSYAKDLVVSDKIKTEQMFEAADKMFKWMVDKDKEMAT